MGLGVAGSVALAGAAVSAGSGLIGSAMQSNAVSGANSSAQAALGQQLNNLAPYRQAGLPAIQAQQDLLGLNGQDAANAAMTNYQTSPGYQWQMQQGLRATDAGAAASGMLRSGAALKAEQTFGQWLGQSGLHELLQPAGGAFDARGECCGGWCADRRAAGAG